MKRISGMRAGRGALHAVGLLSMALLVGCATAPVGPAPAPAAPTPAAAPAPCADPIYVQLREEHPDSLSEREWQRLQTLDRECEAAREALARETDHHADGGHHGMWWMGSGLFMVVMMAAMWIS